jgi:SAM-dependent methyltransferase
MIYFHARVYRAPVRRISFEVRRGEMSERLEFYAPDKTDRTEQSGWEKWHDWQARVMQPVIDWFVRTTRAAPGQTILDVACGSGLPALALAERVGPTGNVVAIDISQKMLTATRRKAEALGLRNVETREANAAAVDAADAVFDSVTCKDGLMFCPDIALAVREMRRVLKPGGRYAFSVWAEPEANPCFTTLFGTLGEVLKMPPPPPDAPGPFRLAGPGDLERVVRAGGFTDVTVERVPVTFVFASIAQHWEIFSETAGPLERAVATLPAPELARLKDKIAEAIASFVTNDGVRMPGLELCVSGTR